MKWKATNSGCDWRRVLAAAAAMVMGMSCAVRGGEEGVNGNRQLVQTMIWLPERWVMRELDSRWTKPPKAPHAMEGTRLAEEKLLVMSVYEAVGESSGRDPLGFAGPAYDISPVIEKAFEIEVPEDGQTVWYRGMALLVVSLPQDALDVLIGYFDWELGQDKPTDLVIRATCVAWPVEGNADAVFGAPLNLARLRKLAGDKLEVCERVAIRTRSQKRAKVLAGPVTFEVDAALGPARRFMEVEFAYSRAGDPAFGLETRITLGIDDAAVMELGYGGADDPRLYFLVIEGSLALPGEEEAASAATDPGKSKE